MGLADLLLHAGTFVCRECSFVCICQSSSLILNYPPFRPPALLSFGGLSPKLGIYPQFRDTISSSGIYQFPSQSIPMVSLYRGQSKKLKLAILIFQIKYQIIIITISFLVQMYAYVIKDEQIGNQNISYTNVRAILTLLVHE